MIEVLENIEETTKIMESNLKDYEDLNEWFAQSEEKWNDFTEDEKEAFRQAFSEFESYTDEPIAIGNAAEVLQDLKQLFRSPIVQAVLESIEDLDSELDINWEEKEMNALEQQVTTTPREELLAIRTNLRTLSQRLEQLSDVVRDYIRQQIEQSPTRILKTEELLEDIEEKEARCEALMSISETLHENDIGEFSDREIGVFSKNWLSAPRHEPEDIVPLIEELAQQVQVAEQYVGDLRPAIQSLFVPALQNHSEELIFEIEQLLDQVESVVERAQALSGVHESAEKVRDMDTDIPQSELILELSETIKENEFDSFPSGEQAIQMYRDTYTQWKHSLKSSINNNLEIARVLAEHFRVEDVPPEPESDVENLVEEDPASAIEALSTLLNYIEAQRAEIEAEGEIDDRSLELLFDLVDQESVPISAYGLEAVEVLEGMVDLRVKIDESL